MASGTILSRVMGFARAVILAAAIGVTTNAADAFGVANQLPNNVYAIIVGGVLNAVLVPQIVKARAHTDGGKGYIDRLLTFILTIFFAVSVLSTIAAPVLVSIYTKDWSGPQLALATALLLFVWLRRALLSRLGGTTGDTAGALVELAECAVLLALALSL